MPSVNLPRIQKTSTVSNDGVTLLARKFGFTEDMAQRVFEGLGKSNTNATIFSKMSLSIKGYGFTKEDIAEIVDFLKTDALNKEVWNEIKKLNFHTETPEIAFYAYKAGLTANDVKAMGKSNLSVENLKVMATLRNF